MTIIPENHADAPTPLPARWADAEKNLLGNILARVSDMPTRRAQHVEHLLAARDLLAGYHWASDRNQAAFQAAVRIAEAGTYPGPDAVIADLRRIGNSEGADFSGELAREFFSDAELGYWAAQCLELSRACEVYSAAARIKAALDAGQAMGDIGTLLADLAAAAGDTDTPTGPLKPHLCDVADIGDGDDSELGPVVIDGYLRAGETMNLNAPAKLGKSWLSYGLAISVALGLKWMGQFQCTPGKVLIVDNELHGRTIKHRIKKVCAAMNIDRESLRGKLHYECFRGRLVRFDELGTYMQSLAGQGFSLIIFDAYYRFFRGDENSNSETATAYNLIDRFTEVTGASIALIHHQSKGTQSDKNVVDTGAGAGSQSRAADTHAVLREHEELGKAVLEARCRTFKTPEPMTLRYAYPLWMAEPDTEPILKALRGKRKTSDGAEPAKPNYMTVVSHAVDEPKPLAWFTAKTGLNTANCRHLLAEAVECGALHLWIGKKPRDPSRWATVPQGIL